MVPTMELAEVFLALGALFLVGLAADQIGRRTRLPRATLLLLCGLGLGGSGLGVLPADSSEWYEFMSVTALTMVAFLLGGSMTRETLAEHGRSILVISVAIVAITAVGVTGGLLLTGIAAVPAVLLGAIATATDPAATTDTIRQSGSNGPFAQMLRGIVAIDDAWGLIAFSLALVVAGALDGVPAMDVMLLASLEIFGALALGVAIGLPAAYVTGRISDGEPLEIEALALVFLVAGLSLWLEVPFLICGMTVGAVIVHRARHHTRAFHEIEHIQMPFVMLFFLLAGAALDLGEMAQLGLIGGAYVVLRIATRLIGGWVGATLAGAPPPLRPLFGPALLPQAGVAVGMSLVAAQRFPEFAGMLLTLTIGTTVAFELLGPVVTLWAIRRAEPAERPASAAR